jgi:hypothetical protein
VPPCAVPTTVPAEGVSHGQSGTQCVNALTCFTGSGIFTTVVNKRALVKLEGAFGVEAIRILREIPGLAVVQREPRSDRGIDAIARFAGNRARVGVEIKNRANAATAWQLVQSAKAHPDTPLLLVADQTTAAAREILEEHGIGVVDGLGNAHIELPGLLLHLEGRRHQGRQPATGTPPTRLSGKAGIVAQALLLQPNRRWQVQDLSDKAQVSVGLAHRVLARLENERIVTTEGTGPTRVRLVANPAALLDLWGEETLERPTRTLAHLLAPGPRQLIKELGRNLGTAGVDYALTGSAAARLVAPFITAVPVAEVWVNAAAAPETLYDGAAADPVTEGHNVVFLQGKDDTALMFREKVRGLWIANRFRLYADLRLDPRRGREQADRLREQVIQF